jgi:hypothetical protein
MEEWFGESYSRALPQSLICTHLWNNKSDLNSYAVELLNEDRVDNFLVDSDFVFMVHHGYVFWYFKADGNPDPTVFGYQEGKLKPDNFGLLSIFIQLYCRLIALDLNKKTEAYKLRFSSRAQDSGRFELLDWQFD